MVSPTLRRVLPVASLLLGLVILTSVVWVSVLQGKSSHHSDATCQTTTATQVPQPGGVSVHVLNSTTRTGLAAGVKKSLGVLGFKVLDVGNDLPLVPGVATIRYGPAGAPSATLLSYYFPGATLQAQDVAGAAVTVSLGTKFHALATTATVKAALLKAHITQIAPKGGKLTPPSATPSPSASC